MEVGFSRKDITPKRSCRMAGYERKKESIGVLDTIEVNTIAIYSNKVLSVICEIDSIMLDEEFCNAIKDYAFKKHKINNDNIIVSCIHTHSAPAFFKLIFEETLADKELCNSLLNQVIESIDEAIKNMQYSEAEYSCCDIDGLYGNRNIKEDWSDKTVQVLTFKNNKIIGSLVNIAVHPTILNKDNLLLSSDLLGAIRSKYSKITNAPVIICNGTTGDVSTRFYREKEGLEELDHVSNGVIEQMNNKLKNKQLNFSFTSSTTCQYITHSDFSKDPITIEKINSSTKKPLDYFFKLRSQKKLELGSFDLNLKSSIMLFGDVFVVGLPGDVVSYFGKQIKSAFPYHKIIIICYSDTYCNYLVNLEQYGKYFETFVSRTMKGEADIFINKVINSMNSLL